MNAHLKSDLIKDHVLNTARSRRQRRWAHGVLAIVLPAGVAAFMMWPIKEPLIVSEEPPILTEPESFVTLSTDDELLDSLAHLGPVIVTREDGSQWLYLTNE